MTSLNSKILSICGGILIHLVLGSLYITGNIEMYLVSYFRKSDPNLTLQQANYLITLQLIGTNFTQFFGSWLCIKYGSYVQVLFRPTILGSSLIILGVFISSFCETFETFMIFYGVLFGIGCGLSVIFTQYTSVLLVAWSRFPSHKPKVSGLIVGAYGLGAFLFNIASSTFINPDNLEANIKVLQGKTQNFYFDQEVASRVPSMLRCLALMYLVLCLFGVVFLGNLKVEKTEEVQPIWPQMRNISFWRLYFGEILAIMSGFYVVTSYKNFGKHTIDDDMFLTVVGSFSSVFNGCLRFVWAYFMEKTSFKTSYQTLLVLQVVFIASIYYAAESKILFFIWVCVILGCQGGHFALLSSLHGELYGPTLGAKIYGIFFSGFGIAALVCYFSQLFVVQHFGYQIMFWLVAVLSTISLVNISTFQPKKYQSTQLEVKLL